MPILGIAHDRPQVRSSGFAPERGRPAVGFGRSSDFPAPTLAAAPMSPVPAEQGSVIKLGAGNMEYHPKMGAHGPNLDVIPCFRRRFWGRTRSRKSRPDPADGVGTGEIGSTTGLGAGATECRPNPGPRRPFTGGLPCFQRRSWLQSRPQASRCDPPDRILTGEIGSATKAGAGKTEDRPNQGSERICSGADPFDRTLGRS